MKKILLSPWLALVTLALILSVRYIDPEFINIVRLKYFDQLITSQPAKDVPVSVVNIDEATLDKYGQFPFPRATYAKLIEELYQHGAGLVVFNIMMPEHDRFNSDYPLSVTLTKHPVVLPELGSIKSKNKTYGTAAQVLGDPSGALVEYPGIIANIPILEERAAGAGIINTFPEVDGVVRRMPLVIMSGDTVHPAIALETLRLMADDTKFQVKIGEAGVEAVRVPKFGRIDTDSLSRVWIDYSVEPRQYSMANLPESFNGEVVIVGLSAAGLINPVATSRGEVWPQDMHAMLLGTMMNQTNIQRSDSADTYELLAILVCGLLVVFFGVWRRK